MIKYYFFSYFLSSSMMYLFSYAYNNFVTNNTYSGL